MAGGLALPAAARHTPAPVSLVSLRFGRERGRVPPLGALWLAGSLRDAGVPWSLVDTETLSSFHAFAVDELVGILERQDDGIVGISMFSDAVPLVVRAIQRLRPRPGRTLVAGGPGVLGLEQRLLAACPQLDAVVSGEGEAALLKMSRHGLADTSHQRLFRRDDPGAKVLRKGRERARATELSSLSSPAWEWCTGRTYDSLAFSMMRGCPFACAFCEVDGLMGRRVRRLEIAQALDDLADAVARTGVRHVQLVDDALLVSEEYALLFFQALRERQLGITYEVFGRPSVLGERLLEALAGSGCVRMFLGIDGFSRKQVDGSRDLPDAAADLEIAGQVARHMEVVIGMMWGHPRESHADLLGLVDAAKELLSRSHRFPIRIEPHLLQPSVSTPLFEHYHHSLVRHCDAPAPADEGTASVLALIDRDRYLGAAFYRYETEAFDDKRRLTETLSRQVTNGATFDRADHRCRRTT